MRSNSNPVCFLYFFSGRFQLIPIPTYSGSSDLLEGFLTFKFHTSASDWDDNVYMGIVRKLVDAVNVQNGKSILKYALSLQLPPMLTSQFSEPAAKAVWETVLRAHENPLVSDPEPMLVDIPMEIPPNPPSKPPRARLRP